METPSTTTPSEYRASKNKIITLSSGTVFKLQKIEPITMSQIIQTLGLGRGEPSDKALKDMAKDPKYIDKIIQAARESVPLMVAEPHIQGPVEKPNTKDLHIDELSPGDLIETFVEGIDFSGLIGATEKMRKKFRK